MGPTGLAMTWKRVFWWGESMNYSRTNHSLKNNKPQKNKYSFGVYLFDKASHTGVLYSRRFMSETNKLIILWFNNFVKRYNVVPGDPEVYPGCPGTI
jgi:hypothetical protein